MNKSMKKIKRILSAGLPSMNDLSIFFRVLIVLFVVTISASLFSYIATPVKAATNTVDSVPASYLKYVSFQVAGCYGLSSFSISDFEFSPLTKSTGPGQTTIEGCTNTNRTSNRSSVDTNSTGLIDIDYGATGRLLNASSSVYDTQLVQPGATAEYYASKIKGEAFAAENPMSGRSVLAPVFILNQNMVNLAYGLVVIILIMSSLNILLSSLTGGEERVTIVQLLINAGVTLIMITFYYEIAAIIYDLTVNYGNALVASIMSPFINSRIILERLSPGGDLAIVNLLNTYQFIGVSDSLLVVTNSIAAGIYPAIAQSGSALASTLGGRGNFSSFNGVASFMQFAGSISSTGVSSIISSFLGNKEVFDAIISWTVFFINLKIFINLLSSFITFTIYVGFGPLIALGGINGGFEKISESFKALVSFGLVFPLTFLFILLGATSMNLFVRTGNEEVSGGILCKYSPNDPANTQQGIIDRGGAELWLNTLIGGNPTLEDPAQARMKNYINQNIFDVVPAKFYNNVNVTQPDGSVTQTDIRDCRPALFPLPWTFIPAPFGTIGQRQLQVQTIDSLIRTFLGIVFLIMASRTPAILEEVLEVKQMGALKGMMNAFSTGAKTFFGVGSTAVGIGVPIGIGVTKFALNSVPIPFLGALSKKVATYGGKFRGWRQQKAGINQNGMAGQVTNTRGAKFRRASGAFFDTASIGDFTRSATESGFGGAKAAYGSTYNGLIGAGFSPEEAQKIAMINIGQNLGAVTKGLNDFGRLIQGANGVIDQFTKSLGEATRSLQSLISLSVIDEI